MFNFLFNSLRQQQQQQQAYPLEYFWKAYIDMYWSSRISICGFWTIRCSAVHQNNTTNSTVFRNGKKIHLKSLTHKCERYSSGWQLILKNQSFSFMFRKFKQWVSFIAVPEANNTNIESWILVWLLFLFKRIPMRDYKNMNRCIATYTI